jgi:hypothetical protein
MEVALPEKSNCPKSTWTVNALVGHLPVSCTIELPGTFAPNPNLRKMKSMERVVIVGRGASGKSTLARKLGDITGLPVTEIDKIFWQPGLIATPRQQWIEMQEQLAVRDRWILPRHLRPQPKPPHRLRRRVHCLQRNSWKTSWPESRSIRSSASADI